MSKKEDDGCCGCLGMIIIWLAVNAIAGPEFAWLVFGIWLILC